MGPDGKHCARFMFPFLKRFNNFVLACDLPGHEFRIIDLHSSYSFYVKCQIIFLPEMVTIRQQIAQMLHCKLRTTPGSRLLII